MASVSSLFSLLMQSLPSNSDELFGAGSGQGFGAFGPRFEKRRIPCHFPDVDAYDRCVADGHADGGLDHVRITDGARESPVCTGVVIWLAFGCVIQIDLAAVTSRPRIQRVFQ